MEENGKSGAKQNLEPMPVKLVFNPQAGDTRRKPEALLELLQAMQDWQIVPEVFLVEPDSDIPGMIDEACQNGHRIFVICGGDGTITSVMRALLDYDAVMGIIPDGTRNNFALSLEIPTETQEAVKALRLGREMQVDIGLVHQAERSMPFLEFCSVGLVSSLFPSADKLQHGDIGQAGEFFSEFIASETADFHLVLDDDQVIDMSGHVVIVSNLPYAAVNFQVGSSDAHHDGLLELHLFEHQNKMELMSVFFRSIRDGKLDDPQIDQYQAKKIMIESTPDMPILADGISLGEGKITLSINQKKLRVIVPGEEMNTDGTT